MFNMIIRKSTDLPKNSKPVFAIDIKGKKVVAFFTIGNEIEVEDFDEAYPHLYDADEVKGTLLLKPGWYEEKEQTHGHYDVEYHQVDISFWLDENEDQSIQLPPVIFPPEQPTDAIVSICTDNTSSYITENGSDIGSYITTTRELDRVFSFLNEHGYYTAESYYISTTRMADLLKLYTCAKQIASPTEEQLDKLKAVAQIYLYTHENGIQFISSSGLAAILAEWEIEMRNKQLTN